MNNSLFTTKQLRSIMASLALGGESITENVCGFDTTLCEITENTSADIEITYAESSHKGLLYVEWSLHFSESYPEAGDAWTFKYLTIAPIPIAKTHLTKNNERL